jgi:hypothetical protein
MADELLAILTGKPASAPASVDRDTDLLVRTVAGEAANQGTTGRQAVAAVARNRAQQTGQSIADVVTAPKQFSAWDDPKTRKIMDGLKPQDTLYQTILTEVGPVLEGKVDPTNGADHYYAHNTIGEPDWAKGQKGTDLGDHRFYKIGYQVPGSDDLASILGVTAPSQPKPGASATPEQEALIQSLTDPSGGKPTLQPGVPSDRETGQPLNEAQQKTVQTLYRGGYYDPKAGTINGRPVVYIGDDGEAPTEPGTLYIDPAGVLAQVPGGDRGVMFGRGGKGLARGLVDVMQSIGQVLPGAADSDVLQTMKGNRLLYTAETRGDPVAGAGRFIGQAIPTTAALIAGGEVLAPLKAASGATGTFLAGEAGAGGSGVANMLLRGSSLAASGAIEGGAAGALVSGSNDDGLAKNVMTGAEFGAALKPLLVGGGSVAGKVLTGKNAGALPATEQNRILSAAESLPVKVPLTQGAVSEAPGQQMAENLMLKGAKGPQAAQIMREGQAATQDALRGNVEAIENKLTGQPTMRPGDGGAVVSDALNAQRKTAKEGVNQAYEAARGAADGAFLPAAERPIVAQRLREAVKDYDPTEIEAVTKVLSNFDGSPTSSTLTPLDLFEARAKLSKLRGTNDPYKGGAAAQAVKALDDYIDDAVKADLISGDPKAVALWKKAIGERRAFGKLFEGRDLIQDLTKQESRGGERTLSVAPEDAANLIFGRSGLGAVGRKNLSRDLTRLKTVLGPDSEAWNALRGEAFKRVAREGEGAPEGGHPQFSGQKFMKAWNKLSTDNPQIVETLFTPDERKLIGDFAEIAQRATTPVKGGDNPSNSGVLVVKKVLENLWTAVGGAVGSMGGPAGAATGATIGRGLDSVFKDMGAVVQAQKALNPKVVKPVTLPQNKLIGKAVAAQPGVLGGIEGNRLLETSP